MSKWYEFQIGLFVPADSEEGALEKLIPVIDAANKIDPEEDTAVELVCTHDPFPFRPIRK